MLPSEIAAIFPPVGETQIEHLVSSITGFFQWHGQVLRHGEINLALWERHGGDIELNGE